MNFEQATQRALSMLSTWERLMFTACPLDGLTALGMSVIPVESLGDQRGGGGTCDGMSWLNDNVIFYARTMNSRRENFTLAHELAHFLIAQDEDLLGWLGDLSDTNRALESVCDRIAAKLLLPDELIDVVLDGSKPRAIHLQVLFDVSKASEPACAIALASRLPVIGAVVIADLFTAEVLFSSIQTGPEGRWPAVYPWRGEMLPSAARLASGADTYAGPITWTNRWQRTCRYYADVTISASAERVHLVLAAADLWDCEPLNIPLGFP